MAQLTLEQVLLLHVREHPRMELQDAVKLIYQNEFAGGHLIADAGESLKRIRAEYASAGGFDASAPWFSPIGNGLVRANLRAMRCDADLVRLNARFVAAANQNRGTEASFFKKLDALLALCGNGALPFSAGEAASFVKGYLSQGHPAPGHSEAYRCAYHPAYRVVRAPGPPVPAGE